MMLQDRIILSRIAPATQAARVSDKIGGRKVEMEIAHRIDFDGHAEGDRSQADISQIRNMVHLGQKGVKIVRGYIIDVGNK